MSTAHADKHASPPSAVELLPVNGARPPSDDTTTVRLSPPTVRMLWKTSRDVSIKVDFSPAVVCRKDDTPFTDTAVNAWSLGVIS